MTGRAWRRCVFPGGLGGHGVWGREIARLFAAGALGPVAALVLVLATASAWATDAFCPLSEYLERYPEQQALIRSFAARVAGPAVSPASDGRLSARVAVIYPGVQLSDYWQRSVDALTARLDELGVEHRIETYFSGPETDAVDQQLAQVRFALQSDPDYLIYTLASPAQRAIIERVMMRTRPKVILQNVTTPVRDWAGMQPFLYVGFDHAQGSRLLAERVAVMAGRGSYVALLPDRALLGKMRGEVFIDALDSSDLTLSEVYLTGIDYERAASAARDALARYPELALMYCATTDIALGAAAVRAAAGADQVLINGWGGGEAELEAIAAGRLDLTVMRHNDDSAVAIAEAIALDRSGRGAEVPMVFAGALTVVTRQTSPEELKALVARAFRYSGAPEAFR